jgi:hypothetical protein
VRSVDSVAVAQPGTCGFQITDTPRQLLDDLGTLRRTLAVTFQRGGKRAIVPVNTVIIS